MGSHAWSTSSLEPSLFPAPAAILTSRDGLNCRVCQQFSDTIIIGPSNSVGKDTSIYGRNGFASPPHVEHCYARLCRSTDLEILFLSEAMAKHLFGFT